MKIDINKIQKNIYLKIVNNLWEYGEEEANEIYPDISVNEFKIANNYFNSLRCEGCYCGSCVNLYELSENLHTNPQELQPIAKLAQKLGIIQFNAECKK